MKPESGQQLNFILLQISQPYQTLMSWEWRKQSPRKSVFIYLFCSLTAQRKHGKQRMLMLTTGVLIEPFQKLETCCTIILCSKHLAAFHKKAWWCIQPPHFLANDTAESIRHIMVTQWISKKRTKTRDLSAKLLLWLWDKPFLTFLMLSSLLLLKVWVPPPPPAPIALLQAALDLKPSSVV